MKNNEVLRIVKKPNAARDALVWQVQEHKEIGTYDFSWWRGWYLIHTTKVWTDVGGSHTTKAHAEKEMKARMKVIEFEKAKGLAL